jgi:hypothetical protein
MRLLRAEGDSTIINATIEDGYLIAGLVAISPFAPSPTEFRDVDTGVGYRVELPIELTNQPLTASFANEHLPLIEVLPCQQPTSSDSLATL